MARGRMWLDDHACAQERRVDTLAEPLHGARVFVAQDDRWIRLEVVVPDVDVRATDPGVSDADDHLAGARFAQLDLAQLQAGVARRDLDEADHAGHSTTNFMPSPARRVSHRGLDLVRSDGAAHEWSQHRLVGVEDAEGRLDVHRQIGPVTHDGELLEHHRLEVERCRPAVRAHDGDGARRRDELREQARDGSRPRLHRTPPMPAARRSGA